MFGTRDEALAIFFDALQTKQFIFSTWNEVSLNVRARDSSKIYYKIDLFW